MTIDAISSTQDNFGVLIKSIVLCKCFTLSFVERNQIKVTPNDIFISVTFRIFDSLLIILSLQVFFCHLISMNSIFNLLFFLTETTPNKTPNKTPQLPPPSQVFIKGTADGLKQELGRLSQNEALIRNAITVLQNTMHELKKTENKLNVTLTTQKRRLDNLFSIVSFSFLFVEDISFA